MKTCINLFYNLKNSDITKIAHAISISDLMLKNVCRNKNQVCKLKLIWNPDVHTNTWSMLIQTDLTIVTPVESHPLVPEMFEERWKDLVFNVLWFHTIGTTALLYHLLNNHFINQFKT